MAKMVKKSVAPIYLVAALWAAWALLFPLYAPLHYILAAAASVLVFVVGKAMFPDKSYSTPDPEPAAAPVGRDDSARRSPEAAPTKPKEKKTTGNPELDKVIEQRDMALAEMHRLNDSIEDKKISDQIDHLEDVTGKIIQHVVDKPEKLPQISQFMNFYLPTTLKLLNAYDRMDATGVSGTNIDGTMGKIGTMMDTVTQAFDKQLDALFGDEALDISTDITVMENLLAREGLGGMQMGG